MKCFAKLNYFIFLGNFTFNGEVSITVSVTEDTKNITLHSLNLIILEWKVYELPQPNTNQPLSRENEIGVAGTSFDVEKQYFILHFNDLLRSGNRYLIFIRYTGRINDNLQGFYRSSYKVGNDTR